MRIRVLGCHGADLMNHGTCGFLINGSTLLDAGTICSALTLHEQRKIRYVLLSHIHVDHVKGLPFLSENLIGTKKQRTVVIISLPEVLSGLHRYVFNDELWPDFTHLPNRRHPVIQMREIREGETVKIDGLAVKAFKVNHTVPCAGFLIRQKNSSLLYSGDTYETTKIWEAAAKDSHLKAAMIEASFPNAFKELAASSKHLTPRLLLREFLKIGKPRLPLYVYHMKPRYLERIKHELAQVGIPTITILKDGAVFNI